MQSSDTATGIRVNCLYHIFSQKWKAKNKQALVFNFGEGLSYFVILRYKLRNLIKIYDDFVNDPINGNFQKTLLLFQIGGKSLVEYKRLWLHTTRKSLLSLSFLITKRYNVPLFTAMYLINNLY